MAEILARTNAEGSVELVDDRSASIKSIDPMTPFDAAYLARGILSCAAALSGTNPPQAGTIVGYAHLPIMTWTIKWSTVTGKPVLILSVPPGIELTFEITQEGAKELGAALVSLGNEQPLPPEGRHGTIH